MLKLYGWQEKFKTRIQESREKEKFVLKKLMRHDAISQALNHLLPNLIPAVCYSVFISLGHSLNLSTAVMTMAYFHKLSWTQNWFPKFLTNYNELEISFQRIQKFLNLPNV